jgi:hypothetical protein
MQESLIAAEVHGHGTVAEFHPNHCQQAGNLQGLCFYHMQQD